MHFLVVSEQVKKTQKNIKTTFLGGQCVHEDFGGKREPCKLGINRISSWSLLPIPRDGLPNYNAITHKKMQSEGVNRDYDTKKCVLL